MSPDRQIDLLARELARTKAALAAKAEGQDLEDALGSPFEFVADLVGERAAVVLFIRFDIQSLGEGLRALAIMIGFKNSPPPLDTLLDEFDEPEQTKSRLRSRPRLQSERKIAERALALARSRAEEGAAQRGPDLKRAIGDPFDFLADRIGEQAAAAFCIRFNATSINVALRVLGWMSIYQSSPPSIGQLLSNMVGEEQVDFKNMPLDSLKVQ